LTYIARNYQTTVQGLIKVNKLPSDFLRINQVLQVDSAAPSVAVQPAVPASTAAVYTIVSGDTLSRIASQFKISLADLMSWNNLTSTLIFPGTQLRVSTETPATPTTTNDSVTPTDTSTETTPITATPVIAPASPSSTEYVIVSGDTLSRIAAQFDVTVSSIKKLNNLSSDLIYPGQTVKISGQAVPATSTPTPVSSLATAVVQEAKKLMGIPYVWGGSKTSGFDCSGFIYYVFNKAGISTSRYNAEGFYSRSHYVDQPQAGDLVFFENTYKSGISHVGIYLGDNQFIHADENKGIAITSLSSNYFKAHFEGFKRFY
jgi:cell wall-associated NlpC family hydrolase